MAIPTALNRDPFLAGVMDAPDPVVRSAMAKVMNPQGLPPMTQKELDRLLNRQYLEQQNVRQAQQASGGKRMFEARQAIDRGMMPPIDVTQYAGSMFSGTDSYTGVRALPAARGNVVQQAADRLLKSQYGEMQPGEVQIADATGERIIQGAPTASGIEGFANTLLTDRFGAMQPGQQVRVAGIADEMLVPAQPTPVQSLPAPAGAPPTTQPAIPSAPVARPTSLGPTLDQLVGARASAVPPSIGQAPLTQMAASDVFANTPEALARSAQQREFERKQAEELRKRNLASAASSFALNQQLPPGLNLTESELNQAYIEGMGMREKGIVRTREDRTVDGKVVPYEVTRNLLTGEKSESQIRSPFPTPEDEATRKSREGFINIGIENIKALREETKLARTKAELAGQMVYAIEQGATTGAGAEVAARIKSLASFLSPSDQDYGAAIQKLFVQAGKLTSLTDVRGIMKGLGAMSNDDRVEAASSFMRITDPKKAIQYYAELNRLNYERQVQLENMVYEMRQQGKTADVIDLELEKMKRTLPFLSVIARENVGFTETAGKPTQPQQPGAGPSFSPEKIRAERARREKLGKQ